MILAAFIGLSGDDVIPLALRQVEVCHAVLAEYRCAQQAVTQHVLLIQIAACDIVGVVHDHGAHHRDTGGVGLDCLCEQVRHQLALELGEEAQDIAGFLVEVPRHTVRSRTVETAVGGHQTECAPALVNVRRSRCLKSADIMAEEAEAGGAQGQSAAECLCHGGVLCGAVAAPVYRELLTADGGASGKQACLSLAVVFFQYLEYGLVVQIGVIVVHMDRICTVVIYCLGGDTLAEVGLDGSNAHLTQLAHAGSEPLGSFRIGEVYDRHARLPQIGLEYAAVRVLDEIALFHADVEQLGLLGDIRVDPAAQTQAAACQTLQHCRRIRELIQIPLEVGPLVLLHPEAVEVEHLERNVALCHTVDEGGNGLFIIGCGEGGGQPQTKGLCRRQCRLSGEVGVVHQNLLQAFAADEEVVQLFARNGEGDLVDGIRSHLEGNLVRAVDQNAVLVGGDIERDALIALLGACAAVGVPVFYVLTVLDEGSELFAEAVNALADIQGQLFPHKGVVGILGIVEEVVVGLDRQTCIAVELVFLDIGGGTPAAAGEALSVTGEGNIPAVCALLNGNGGLSGSHGNEALFVADLVRHIALREIQLKLGLVLQAALVVADVHTDHVRCDGGVCDLECDTAQCHCTVPDRTGSGKDLDAVFGGSDIICLNCIGNVKASLVEPESVRKFHGVPPAYKNRMFCIPCDFPVHRSVSLCPYPSTCKFIVPYLSLECQSVFRKIVYFSGKSYIFPPWFPIRPG